MIDAPITRIPLAGSPDDFQGRSAIAELPKDLTAQLGGLLDPLNHLPGLEPARHAVSQVLHRMICRDFLSRCGFVRPNPKVR